MKKVNIFEAKARLSEFIEAVEQGERVVICRRNRPVAELRAISPGRTAPRPIAAADVRLEVPAAFFDPLPDVLVDTFYPTAPVARGGPSIVAERRASKGAGASRRTRRPRA